MSFEVNDDIINYYLDIIDGLNDVVFLSKQQRSETGFSQPRFRPLCMPRECELRGLTMISTTGMVREIDLGVKVGKVVVGSYELYELLFDDQHNLRNNEAKEVDEKISYYVLPDALTLDETDLVKFVLTDSAVRSKIF